MAYESDTSDAPTTSTEQNRIITGKDDKNVCMFLQMLGDDSSIHNRHEGIWRAIQVLFEQGFSIQNPSGTQIITSKLLLQLLWKTANKMKIPDFKIYKAGPFKLTTDTELAEQETQTREWTEQIVTAAVATIMKEGGFVDCMRAKGGAFFKGGIFGDTHIQIGYDADHSDYPIRFRVTSLSDFFTNSQATDIRDPVGGLSADATVEIFRYTIKQFNALWPEYAGKVAPGEIPRSQAYMKQLEKTWLQEAADDNDMIDVGYGTSIDKKRVVFAGAACTPLQTLEGDEGDNAFPFIIDGKPYLPTLHFKFFPSSEGYYNYGIGHMVYDIALLAAQMDNMAYKHAGDNIWPINLVNSSTKAASKLFNDILKAEQMRNAGGRGYVVSENPGGGAGVTVDSFQSAPITEEWERAFTRLEQQITRMGFNLDTPDLGSSPNEMSIMWIQESTDAPIKQIIEWNAPMFEEAVDFTMDFIRKFVDDDDQTPLNSLVEIEMGDGTIPLRGIPLGWVAKELRQNKYFTVVNSRDGTVPSSVMETAQIDQTMNTLTPGSPAWNKFAIKRAKTQGMNLKAEDLALPGQPQAPSGGGGVPPPPPPTETSPVNAVTLKNG